MVRLDTPQSRRWTVPGPATLWRRFEASSSGQAAISGLVALAVLIGAVWNMPDSDVKSRLKLVLTPIAETAGLEQTWRMYAPEPIRRLETVEVHVTMSDGSDREWTNHPGDRLIGHFAWYHWQKLKEQTIREPYSRLGLAHWVVGFVTSPSEHPVHVRMILRTEELPPPGSDGPRTTAIETLYDENLART